MMESLLRTEGERLLFAAFFGALAFLAILETIAAMRSGSARRWQRWPANFALTAINIFVMGALPLSQLAVADLARDHGIGFLNRYATGPAVSYGLTFLAFSLQSWAVHMLMHKVPLLWRLHRVHHADTHLDVSTTVRFHPVELLMQTPISAAIVLALGAPPAAVILYGIFDAVVNAFSHANLRLPTGLERVLGWFIVTPHLHRIHHSPEWPETDSNFGATLPIWDRLFGTFRTKTPDDLAEQAIGLWEMQDERAWSLWWMLSLPFRPILRHGSARKRKSDDAPANLPADR